MDDDPLERGWRAYDGIDGYVKDTGAMRFEIETDPVRAVNGKPWVKLKANGKVWRYGGRDALRVAMDQADRMAGAEVEA